MNDELTRELEYLRRCCELDAGKILALDSQCIAIRQELELKRRGFGLMAELAATLRHDSDYESIFVSISRRINSALNMERCAVLVRESGRRYRPSVLQGYPEHEAASIRDRVIEADDEMLDPAKPILVTGEDVAGRLAGLRASLGIKYLITSPVAASSGIVAILAAGRNVEQPPFLSRLSAGDVETMQTVSAHLAALLASQRVVEAEERTKIMLDATPMVCVLFGSDGNRLACNQETVRLFGVSGKQEYLDRFYDLSPEFQPDGRRSAELAHEKLRRASEEGFLRFEWMHRKLDGELIPSEITLVRVRYGFEYIIAGYTRDLREQKAMLGAMLKKEEELLAARDTAEKNARAKSEFLANISHEIRTPMNAVLGINRLLENTGLDPSQREYLHQAARAADLLMNVIDDLLDFSSIDTGRMKLKREPFLLRKSVSDVVALVREQAEAKSLELISDVGRDVPDGLIGDHLRLEQILMNIAGNAVKFTSAGSVRISVSLRESAGDEATLFFEVEDTGIGVTEEEKERLFMPFTQADTSRTRRYGGTGLGLAISRSLVNMMGGDIYCEPGKDAGSRFCFTVKLGLDRPAVYPAEKGREADDFSSLEGMRVLLVEDNEVNQLIASELLSARGAIIDVASTGVEAIKLLERGERYDAVLMDIQMPEMDGITATIKIRENPEFRDLPIIALTAHALPEDRELNLKSGMNDHLTKPIDPVSLYRTLRYWVSGRG
jgi:signal transduction histidine kinase/CheY-like chemotaxis protein